MKSLSSGYAYAEDLVVGDVIAVSRSWVEVTSITKDDDWPVYVHYKGGGWKFKDSCQVRLKNGPRNEPDMTVEQAQNKCPSAASTVASTITNGATLAAKMAAMERLNAISSNLLIEAMENAGVPDAVLDNETVKVLVRLISPVALSAVAGSVPALAKHARAIERASTLAFAGELKQLIDPLLAGLKPHTEALIDAAKIVDTTATEGMP